MAEAGPAWAESPWGLGDRLVVLALALAWGAFLAVTWGRWVWPTADSARELLVPFQLAQGLPLYREVSFLYGPFAPALQAWLLRALAPRVELLIALNGLVAAFTSSALYVLARRALPLRQAWAVPFLVATACMIGPDLQGHLWPYAHAATFGLALGLGCLWALTHHAAHGRLGALGLAGLLGGLAVATKLEFGFGALLALLAYGLWRAWAWRLRPPGGRLAAWGREAGVALGGGLLALGAMACWALGQASWPEIQAEVWPTRLMALWHSQGAWKGHPQLWLQHAKWLLLDAGLVLLLAGLGWWGRRAWAWALLALGALGAWWLAGSTLGFLAREASGLWYGPTFAPLFLALAWALARGPQGGQPALLAWLVGAYGLGVAARSLFVGLNAYSPYQAPVAFLAWVALAAQGAPWLWAQASGWAHRQGWALGEEGPPGRAVVGRLALAGLALALGLQQLGLRLRAYARPHAPVTGAVGTIVPPREMAEAFGGALAHLGGAMGPREGLLALPMDGAAYSFLGRPNPLVQANLYLGYLTTPEEEAQAIARLGSRGVRWVWISNYGQLRLGQDYLPQLMAFVRANGHEVAHFGAQRGAYGLSLWRLPPPEAWRLPPGLGGGPAWRPREAPHED